MTWIKIADVVKMINTHDPAKCAGRPCVVHSPTQHSMSDRPVMYRADRGIFERVCVHGVGHPDPDQESFWEDTGQEYQAIHGCDGCCAPVESGS